MKSNSPNQFKYEVSLEWQPGNAVLSCSGKTGSFEVSGLPSTDEENYQWSPEHLLLGSAGSSFMSTFIQFAQNGGLNLASFTCPVAGRICFRDGRYQFVAIDIYPTVIIYDEDMREKAEETLEKTQQLCIITNTVNIPVFFHTSIDCGDGMESFGQPMRIMRREIM